MSTDIQQHDTDDVRMMSSFFAQTQTLPSVGEIIEGRVINMDTAAIYVDLPPYGTGIIYGREYIIARDIIKKVRIGEVVSATIVEVGNEDGYIELSLKEARQAQIWSDAERIIREKEPIEIPIKEANKGGLIVEWHGIQGFIPASQLNADHYPRVEDGDKDKIFEELKKLVGQTLTLSMITADPKEQKMIFSEKGVGDPEKAKMVDSYQVGDVIEGEVTGAVDFGVFIKIEDNLEGLAHISELDWGLVKDPRTFFTVGEKVKAKVIEVKDSKISLSVKALKENPWERAAKTYEKGKTVDAVVIKYNKYGALASVEEGVAGLVHVSEFESEEKLREALELGKSYSFKINLFDPKDQKMTLSFIKDDK